MTKVIEETADLLVRLDPRELVVDKNVRSKLGDLKPLTDSIREYGVLVPLLVVPENGSHRVVAGARRTAAAIKAERFDVPCIVRAGIDGDQALLEAQLIENLGREDLSTVDIAKGFEQLVAFGLDEAQIATLTTRSVAEVKSGVIVAASAPAQKALKNHPLTLDQAAVIAEFGDNDGDVSQLTQYALEYPGKFDHQVAAVRSRREEVAKADKLEAELVEQGVKIGEAKPSWDRRLPELTDAKGKKLTPAGHKKCPGHYAYIERPTGFGKAEVIYACDDPKGNGHKSSSGHSSRGGGTAIKSDAQKEADSAKRKEVIANNKAWRAAESVRLPFVRELLKRKTAKGVLRFVTEEIVGAPSAVRAEDKVLCDLLGIPEPKDAHTATDGFQYSNVAGIRYARKETDARLPMVLLAQIAACREESMGIHTWRNDGIHSKLGSSGPARWLAFLAANGYTLSEVEQLVR